uniref:Solute carrier family 23 member 1 n=1 Tax=Malurus cyaneus samueli TaxID=2593467 RepID=A0A8C5TXV3_9PASS
LCATALSAGAGDKLRMGDTSITQAQICEFSQQHGNDIQPVLLHPVFLCGLVAIPLILSKGLCLQNDLLTQSHLISTIFFVSGICTMLQVLLGVRLPIVQGGTFTFVTPTLAMLSLPSWKCPAWTQNATLVNTSSPEFIQVWQTRMREVQGAIVVASCFQIFVGFSGLIGFLMKFIGPLTIAPTITLVALPLFESAGDMAGEHWGIAFMTIFFIILFSQYLKKVAVPLPSYQRGKKCHFSPVYLFQIFPVLLGLSLSWLLCYMLTVTGVLPADPTAYGHMARTDTRGDVLSQAPWFRLPYPGQWGKPTVSLAGIFGLLAGVISSMLESVGDYFACARLCGAPPPPKHAISRGIGVEGIGCLLAGAWGTGSGTTSYSENVGALGITKVGSRMVIIAGACAMLLSGIFGKVGAMLASIPTPVIGGMFLVIFGVIAAVGISNLQYTDMNSSRNIFVFGFSVFAGLTIPSWASKNSTLLETGIIQLDQVILVLLTTSMFVGGLLGFILDNTIPGRIWLNDLLVCACPKFHSMNLPCEQFLDPPWQVKTCLGIHESHGKQWRKTANLEAVAGKRVLSGSSLVNICKELRS